MNHTPLQQFLDAYAGAVRRRDRAGFLALYAPDVQVFDCWDTWAHEGRAAWARMVDAWFSSIEDDSVVAVSAHDVRPWAAGDRAGGSARLRFAALDARGAELRSIESRLSVVLQRTDAGWQVVHEHTSVPVEFLSQRAVPRPEASVVHGS